MDRKSNKKAEITKTQQVKIWSACALQAFWVMGINQSFGIFQVHYGSDKAVKDGITQPEDKMQRAGIAAIQSLGNGGIVAAFAMLFFPRLPLIGKHIRTLCFGSAMLATIGFATAAACNEIWLLLLTQGLFVGIGNGVFFHVLATILPEYFEAHSGLAQGAASGSGSIGGVILSLSLPKLLKSVGSRWTLGILSILSMCFLSAASFLAQPPRHCQKRSIKPVGWKAFKDPTFTLLFMVNLIHPLTVAIPTTFGPEFSEALGYDIKMASIILAISSVVGIPARFLMGNAADKIGHNNMLFVGTTTFAVSTLVLWLSAAQTSNGAVWIVYNVVYGCVFGIFGTVINSVQKRHFGDELYYSYNGALSSIRGVGYMVGVPIAGSLVTRVKDSELHGNDFVKPIVYTGTLLMVSALCVGGVGWLDSRKAGGSGGGSHCCKQGARTEYFVRAD
ncbi:hypothetical protein SLS60_004895 [Paraconiothyrium brasiliense]|uniref:Major facilitator superfamily (MFS) profile domain-containing protein n=1 Tax=Paraconiothyrium brasiliense TaxID=300254 RepID=A0ABR3RLT8_9PLEO